MQMGNPQMEHMPPPQHQSWGPPQGVPPSGGGGPGYGPTPQYHLHGNLTITTRLLTCRLLWINGLITGYLLMEEKLQCVYMRHQMPKQHRQWLPRLLSCFPYVSFCY